MVIYAIDDEPLALHVAVNAIKEAAPEAELQSFTKPADLREAMKHKACDVAFLDIQMRGITGLELAGELQEKNPQVNIVFVTGYQQFMGEAWDLLASGYISKPATAEKIRKQLENLRYPLAGKPESRVKIITFGNFSVFSGGEPVNFHRAKSRELLAYLVDRQGTVVTRREAADILFESGRYEHREQSYLNQIIRDLTRDLEEAGAGDILICTAKDLAVKPDAFSCDSYDYLAGKGDYLYNDEYMSQYSWAEYLKSKFDF